MDRLTRKINGRYGVVPGYELDTLHGAKEVVTRLAAYEDTGLEPEEIEEAMSDCAETVAANQFAIKDINEMGGIDHLRKLVQAEEDGRLVVLPCKVGTPVWYVEKEIVPNGGKRKWKTQLSVKSIAFDFSVLDWIDTPIYLTREEAEAALKGGEN